MELARVFALDVCAYAVMSNHYHIVLHINAERANAWSTEAVINRWHTLFKGTTLTQRYLTKSLQTEAEIGAVESLVVQWRDHLTDISWFMRVLNEGIARQANFEDQCTGRFWEGRFKSQALLDESALAACLAYVDLNPVRAKMASSPEQSDYTSAQQRIMTAQQSNRQARPKQPKSLFPFVGYPRQQMPEGLPFRLQDYLELLDWTGRQMRRGKKGKIDESLSPILERLNIDPDKWLYTSMNFESSFKSLVGSTYSLISTCRKLGYQRTPGRSASALLSQ